MATLKDLVAYFCKRYPHKNELSKARLTKMVYLADWKSALVNRSQITDLKWVFNHFGPYVDDVVELALSDNDFTVGQTANAYGNEKEVISLSNINFEPELSAAEKLIADEIIQITATKYWNSFIELVYSTYPVRSSQRYEVLDLVRLANNYMHDRQTMTKSG